MGKEEKNGCVKITNKNSRPAERKPKTWKRERDGSLTLWAGPMMTMTQMFWVLFIRATFSLLAFLSFKKRERFSHYIVSYIDLRPDLFLNRRKNNKTIALKVCCVYIYTLFHGCFWLFELYQKLISRERGIPVQSKKGVVLLDYFVLASLFAVGKVSRAMFGDFLICQ